MRKTYLTTLSERQPEPARNMYGCLPCPRCGSIYRYPWTTKGPTKRNVVACDDCGRYAPWDGTWGEDGYSVNEKGST